MVKHHLKLATPAIVNRTVIPKRPPNADLRTREYLTEAEVERLINAAKGNRWGHRDATMILVAYRHALRASELVDLRGIRWILGRPPCMSAGSNRVLLAPIPFWEMNYALCGGFTASRSRSRRLYSRRSAGRPLPPQGSPVCSSEPQWKRD
jgi:hypothetical protein